MTDPLQMLKRLSPAVAPVDVTHAAGRGGTSIETSSFDELLLLASSDRISSGRAVDARIELQEPLEAAQMQRLEHAADLAERHGAERALMLIDGRALIVNVPDRAIIEEPAADNTDAVLPVDVSVLVRAADDGEAAGRAPAGPGWIMPTSVADQLQMARGSQQ